MNALSGRQFEVIFNCGADSIPGLVAGASNFNRAYAAYRVGTEWCIQLFDSRSRLISADGEYYAIGVVRQSGKSRGEFNTGKTSLPIGWDELMYIKSFFFPEHTAIELYPRREDVVNDANMRWLWVLPRGLMTSGVFPFNLNGSGEFRI